MTTEDITKALGRIGRTRDGKALRQLLLVEVQKTISDVATDGALRVHGARRNFAAELLRKLDPDHDGRTDTSLADPARSAHTPGAQPGARRRVPDTAD